MFCSSCGNEVPSKSKYCSACGSQVGLDAGAGGSDEETIAPSTQQRTPAPTSKIGRAPSSGAPRVSSSDPIGGGRFTPGIVIAGRYRIVALAGRGGMGEVYRAEDLKLSQTVAVKFLPEKLTADPPALERFHSEVRIARQVSHPNVCRVFDIGETDGVSYLTMEYVDGEDLASLIRRIGRLSPDKAAEIARQICAGLAAAHERGVIHRDLKPANVMLDSQGKARITDFGLAGLAATIEGAEVRAGTPAYMAPEQLAGREVTLRSDLYSLGLVLYELLTGKRAFEATTLQELIRQREQGELSRPSTIVKDLDPLLERVILRCVEKDPLQRPASALQVAAALPGGDPLAAALAAGETPSPEMVAASGQSEGLRPSVGLACFAGILGVLALFLFLVSQRTKMASMLPFADSPEALSAHCRELIRSFGYRDAPADAAWGFILNSDYLNYLQKQMKTTTRWDALRADQPPGMLFWYRQSPRPLISLTPQDNLLWGRVTPAEPELDVSGMTVLRVTLGGHLLHFEAVPPQVDTSSGESPTPDWNLLFAAAGLDPSKFKTVAPTWFPPAYADSRAAWEGTWPSRGDIPLRIEAAAYRGRPIFFRLISPWSRPERMTPPTFQNRIGQIFSITILCLLIFGGAWIARRNIVLGRGDFQGAARLAVFILCIGVVNWALLAHHNSTFVEVVLFILAISVGLFFAAFTWLLYVALEPYVRRHWPGTIVSWTRMLQFRFRDPVVGRDILLGTLFGVVSSLLEHQEYLVEKGLGRIPGRPTGFSLYALEGMRGSFATVFASATAALTSALVIFFVFFVFRLIFRKSWIAAIAMSLLYCIPSFGAANPWIDALLFTFPFILAFLLILQRYGLVCLAALFFADQMANNMPIVSPLNAWFAQGGVVAIVVLIVVAAYGFQMSRAGKPLFATSLLDS